MRRLLQLGGAWLFLSLVVVLPALSDTPAVFEGEARAEQLYRCELFCGTTFSKGGKVAEVSQSGASSAEARDRVYDRYGRSGACHKHFGRPSSEILSVDCYSK
jgi:hypothetical protein